MANTRSWSGLFAFVYLLMVLPAAMVNGMRREEFILGLGPAPAPVEASPEAGGSAKAVGVDATGKRFTAATVGEVRMSKWRVGRGSDPIHNRS
jgi:hypothetical protein